MHPVGLRHLLQKPGTAALLLCLTFGLGFFLGAWTIRSRSGDAVIVARGEAASPTAIAAEPVNINTADVSELERLPGIGSALAARIVAYREEHGSFSFCYELTDVSGIGSSVYEGLLGLITVEEP